MTAAQTGARWGVLYVQELTVRLGMYSGRGYGELIREQFGARCAWLSLAGRTCIVLDFPATPSLEWLALQLGGRNA
ncbi:MAG: hypothetical protein ACREDL_15280 [Bradyrhizobium sp.]